MIAKIFDIISLIQRLNSVYFLIFWLFVKTVLKTLIRRNCAAKSMSLVFALSKTMAFTDGGLRVAGQSPYLLLIASNTPSFTKPLPTSGLWRGSDWERISIFCKEPFDHTSLMIFPGNPLRWHHLWQAEWGGAGLGAEKWKDWGDRGNEWAQGWRVIGCHTGGTGPDR